MLRRRLRLTCSSDEEDGDGGVPPPLLHQPSQHSYGNEIRVDESHVHVNSNVSPSEAIDISDDDEFIDVSDNFLPPSPPPPPPPTSNHSFEPDLDSGAIPDAENSFDNQIDGFFRLLGLRVKSEWLDSCVSSLETSVTGFVNLDVAEKAKLCFEQFLFSDMNYSGGGVLPENVSGMHLVDLAGPFVLQVDEIINISSSLRGRYENANPGMKRCLKLSLTDGVQRVFGMEYRPIKGLEVLAPAGFKVVVCNVHIRHGLLILVPEAIEVLGGLVEELDAARQRLVHEINKPPRGIRTRTGEVPSLATRARLAAWSSNGDGGVRNTNGPVPQNSNPLQANDTRVPSAASFIDASETILEERAVPTTRESAEANHSNYAVSGVNMVDENNELNNFNPAVFEDEYMFDAVEHPVMLTGDKEIPFTYLASLFTRRASTMENRPVQGKIKCFLTGVKGFYFKQRPTFELRVYVDDGSLISEILIDHNVVQNSIGYSPEEVTAALKSSNKETISNMKDTMKQYQMYLAHFEGTMLVEISGDSTLPVALEMSQGCPTSDAWALLRRVKTFNPTQLSHHPNPNVTPSQIPPHPNPDVTSIDISP